MTLTRLQLNSSFKQIRFTAHLDDWIQQQLFFIGEYYTEREIGLYWKHVLRPGMTIIDAGANMGYYSLLAARATDGEGVIIAFEPFQETYDQLAGNIRANGIESIEALPMALGARDANISKVYMTSGNTGMHGLTPIREGFEAYQDIQLVSLDQYLMKRPGLQPDIIKIDVEGYEWEVLQGAKETIERHHPIILVEVLSETLERTGRSPKDIYDFFQAIYYEPYTVGENGRLHTANEVTEGNIIVFKPVAEALKAGIGREAF